MDTEALALKLEAMIINKFGNLSKAATHANLERPYFYRLTKQPTASSIIKLAELSGCTVLFDVVED